LPFFVFFVPLRALRDSLLLRELRDRRDAVEQCRDANKISFERAIFAASDCHFDRYGMPESPLLSWDNFYVIVGSSAGALTGLQFVVMALVSDLRKPASSDTIGAFGTPTIVHFSVVLTLSAVLSAPWPSLAAPEWILGVAGAVGLVYVGIVTFRAARQDGYKPVFEDWFWHTVLPFISYALLLGGSITMSRNTTPALFMIATMAMLLLLIGIHNAWDTVTFIVVQKSTKAASESK
jgi:hypothetical protein